HGAALDNFEAKAATQLTASLPFSDDFSTTSDGSQLDGYWTDQKGNITVVNGMATGVGSVNLATVNILPIDQAANVSVTADMSLTSVGQTAGLVTRYSGPLNANYYLGQISSTSSGFQTSIWRNIGGTLKLLATGLTVGSLTGALEFEAVGP